MTTPPQGGRAPVVHKGLNANSRVVGATPDYLSVRNLALANGDFISASNISGRASVVVLGSNVANSLFGNPTAGVGNVIKVNRQPFKVVGVLMAKGGAGFGSQDDQSIVPITTAQTRPVGGRRQGASTSVDTINVRVVDAQSIPAATSAIGDTLRQRHKVLAGAEDFTLHSQADLLSTLTSVTNTLTVFLGGIAGISLVVGGIGEMNIMLVSAA